MEATFPYIYSPPPRLVTSDMTILSNCGDELFGLFKVDSLNSRRCWEVTYISRCHGRKQGVRMAQFRWAGLMGRFWVGTKAGRLDRMVWLIRFTNPMRRVCAHTTLTKTMIMVQEHASLIVSSPKPVGNQIVSGI